MKFTLTIELGNDAMQYLDRDLAPALREVARSLTDNEHSGRQTVSIKDINGNTVGSWKLSETLDDSGYMVKG